MSKDELRKGYDDEIKSDFRELLSRESEKSTGLVFHYASAKSFRGIIEQGEIWLSNAAYLNDLSELIYSVGIAHEVVPRDDLKLLGIGDMAPGRFEERLFLSELARKIGQHAIFKPWYTASFSFDGNDLSQWRAYCPTGGYAIGFDMPSLIEMLSPQLPIVFGAVEYDQQLQRQRIAAIVSRYTDKLKALTEKYPDAAEDRVRKDLLKNCERALSRELLFLKNSAFSSEREWRIGCHAAGVTPGFRIGREGVLVPYVNLDLKGKGNKPPISEVWIAPIGNQELAEHSAYLMLQSNGHDPQIIQRSGYQVR